MWPPAIGMPAAEHAACAAFEDAADGRGRQHGDRHADQRQREQRARAHRVDVRQRVGRGDAAEVVRVVDDRHEEVGRRDDRVLRRRASRPPRRRWSRRRPAVARGSAAATCRGRARAGRTAPPARSCSRSRRRATGWSGAARRPGGGRRVHLGGPGDRGVSSSRDRDRVAGGHAQCHFAAGRWADAAKGCRSSESAPSDGASPGIGHRPRAIGTSADGERMMRFVSLRRRHDTSFRSAPRSEASALLNLPGVHLMNNIVWLVGAVVIVLAILGFLGLR